jgi:glycosyltransferase involved in cell wall biosynthesis
MWWVVQTKLNTYLNSNPARPLVKILHVVGSSKFGGASRIVVQLAQMAAAEGWHAAILASDPAYAEFIQSSGVELVPLNIAHREVKPWRDMADMMVLRRYLLTNSQTVVHTHTSKGGFLGRIAARLANVPVIIHTAHGFAIHEDSPWHEKVAYAGLERFAAAWCSQIVCVSDFHRDWAASLGIAKEQKLISIPNGIALDRIRPISDPRRTRTSLQIDKGEFLIVCPGRVTKQKGLEYLIDAMAQTIRKALRPFRLLIVGEGPLAALLQQQIESLGLTEHVKLLGFRSDVGDVLAAADLVVLPSEREGLSVALLEALAAGRPLVLSGIGSNREVAAKGDFSIIVPPRDAKAIADAICTCLQDSERLSKMASSAVDVYQRHYTATRMVSEYATLYGRLLEAAGILNSSHQVMRPLT